MKKITDDEERIEAEEVFADVVEVVMRFGGQAAYVMYAKWYEKASAA